METFSFMFRGALETVDLTPFGENFDRSLGHEARAEKAASLTNRLVILQAEFGRDYMQTKCQILSQHSAAVAMGKSKDTGTARDAFLAADSTYIESRRIRDFLDQAVSLMIRCHYPRMRDLANRVDGGIIGATIGSQSPQS